MKILITGCLGHIGTYIIENINKINKFSKVILLDDLNRSKINNLLFIKKKLQNSKFVNLDLSEKNVFKKLEKVDVVLHLASMTDAEGSLKIKKKIYKNNLDIFENIVKYIKLHKNTKLIHISSTSVYGQSIGLVNESETNLNRITPNA